MPVGCWKFFTRTAVFWFMSDAPRLLHVFPGFGPGGTQLRMASIINALGGAFAHRIISLDGTLGAAAALAPDIEVTTEGPPATRAGIPRVLAFRETVKSQRPAAVLTYNWGAIEATLGARLAGCCPVIHNECGFGQDETTTLVRRRVWARRALLNTIFRTVATSHTMYSIARNQYKLPARKVQLIRTGVDLNRYRPWRNEAGRRELGLTNDTVLFGYLGGLRPEKNLGLLIRSFHAGGVSNAKLVLAGEGPCRRELEDLATKLELRKRVVFLGHQPDPCAYLALLDVFVMSSATEQVSNAQLEAMASGLPVVCTDVGDSRELLGEAAMGWAVAPNDEAAYTRALRKMAADPDTRLKVALSNRARAVNHYSKVRMVDEYGVLLQSAIPGSLRNRDLGSGQEYCKESCTRLESGI
jgi:glycosyltransferase involved in cell wall biosynthesis